MEVLVNGAAQTLEEGTTITQLLDHLQISRERVAIEINLEIMQREECDRRVLQNGDRVEIISFMGGGQELPLE